MKRCPECKRDYYDETLLYCLDDGTRLLEGPAADESVTQLFHQAPLSLDQTRGDLPAERTRFIGRKRELSDCVELLTVTRLLTITGFGGCGKTRLAIKSAELAAKSFPGGAWFVDLEPVADENLVVSAIARALQLREGGANLTDTLVEQIGQGRLLIILDNCEHILSAVGAIVDELLNRCPGVRIIATSREPLNVQGEKVFSLQPLAVPYEGVRRSGADNSDAIDLFVDRAVIAQTGFALTDHILPVVADIVTKLDGIPLAIELAAARLRVLSVDQINEKLDQRFKLLAGSPTSRVSRHQTLHAAIQWSYDPLSDDEKNLLETLSVFSGSCDLDQITAVYGRFDEFTTLDLLARLVDKSLVIVESERGSQKRYRLLETIRQFALAILSEHGEEAAARRSHLETMLALAERAYQGRISNEDEWADVLELDTSNMQQALEFARISDSDAYLKLAGALGWYWTARSHISEGSEHLSAALKATSRDPARVDRARALWAVAHIEAWRGNLDAANLWMDEALECCHNLGDTSEVAIVLEGIGWSQFSSGKDEDACASFEECLRIQRAGGDPLLINRANVGLAQTLVALGRIDEARPMAQEIIEFSKAHADKRNEHFGWHYLADCALIEGDCGASLDLYKRSLALAAETGDKIEIAFEIQGVAMSLAGLGRLREAEVLDAAVRAEMNRIGADIHVRFWDALLEKYLSTAQHEAGMEIEQARIEGASMAFFDAVAMALRVDEKSSNPAAGTQGS
ncbi:MAG TPA: NB-ARC domain-containing protein [Pyrinomonadaceae bacterium]